MRTVPGAGNLGFDDSEVTVLCFGKGGGTLRPGDQHRSVLNILSQSLSTQPAVIYFHMGENDLSILDHDQISSSIMSLSYYVSSVCFSKCAGQRYGAAGDRVGDSATAASSRLFLAGYDSGSVRANGIGRSERGI
jgi:hypothetical protein